MRRLLPFLLLSGCSTTCANGMCRQAGVFPIVVIFLLLLLYLEKRDR